MKATVRDEARSLARRQFGNMTLQREIAALRGGGTQSSNFWQVTIRSGCRHTKTPVQPRLLSIVTSPGSSE